MERKLSLFSTYTHLLQIPDGISGIHFHFFVAITKGKLPKEHTFSNQYQSYASIYTVTETLKAYWLIGFITARSSINSVNKQRSIAGWRLENRA